MRSLFIIALTLWSLTGVSQNIVVSGAGSNEANGTFIQNGTFNSRPLYEKLGSPNIQIAYGKHIGSSNWAIGDITSWPLYVNSSTATSVPYTGWSLGMMGMAPLPTVMPSGPSLLYNTSLVWESSNNDGSLTGGTGILINLNAETFTGTNSEDFVVTGKAVVYNLPAGLTVEIIRISSTQLSMNIIGNANNHDNINDCTLQIDFLNSAFTGNDSSLVFGHTNNSFQIEFFQEHTVGSTGDFSTMAAALAGCESGDILSVLPETFTESGLTINKDITIIGQGATQTIIQAASTPGTASNRVFNVSGNISVRIEKLTIRHGNISAASGGGIEINTGVSFTIQDCEIRDNYGQYGGGGIHCHSGYSPQLPFNVINCTFANNSMNAENGCGGGINCESGLLFISNCTFYGNQANSGGAIRANTFTIENSTITGNHAFQNWGTLQGGGGLFVTNSNPCYIKNCIVAGNTQVSGKDNDITTWAGSYYVSGGNNIIGDVGTVNFASNTNGDIYYDPNATTSPSIGALESASPLNLYLGTLALNGGQTRTCAIGAGSLAIDPLVSNNAPTTDQRHYLRTGTADIGSYEYNGFTCENLTVLSSATNPNCYSACTGSLTANASGGQIPYTYSLNGGAPVSSSTFNNLCAGSYMVIATDANGCTKSLTSFVTLTNPDTIIVYATSTSPTCYGSFNGAIDQTVTGGVLPYTYQWSNGASTQDIQNISAGTYTVTITDGILCQRVFSYVLTGPAQVSISFATTSASCGNPNGTVAAYVSGGTSPHTYLWSTGSDSTGIIGLNPGIYMLQITDANGCSGFSVATVSSLNGPVIQVEDVTNVACYGGSNGAIDISVSSGTPPYTYHWSNGITTQDISGLQYGPYEVVVEDVSGCESVMSITVDQPGQIQLSYTGTMASCGLSDGSAEVSVSGGTSPFIFIWSSGHNTAAINSVPAGVYFCSVLDAHNCPGGPGSGFSVTNDGGPVVIIDSVISPTCTNPAGAIYVTSTGGTMPYTFYWSNDSTTEDIAGLTSGQYSLTVTDNGGCLGIASATVQTILPLIQPVCIVTVDSLTGKNLVVWEKVQTTGIANYRIWRETSQMNVYQAIATVPYDSLSLYLDQVASPLVHAWRYKISAVDSCGNESPLSPNHKTIHLTINQGLGSTWNLIWDDYEGFNYLSVIVARYTMSSGWEILDTLPASFHSYTDFSPPAGNIWYTVAAMKPGGPCLATKESGGGPYSQSVSNMEDNAMDVGFTEVSSADNSLMLYPNPFSDYTRVTFSYTPGESFTVVVYDVWGKTVFVKENVREGTTLIERKNLAPGYYTVEVQGSRVLRAKMMVQD
jgi:hypothetical protein